jgi:hypothetical protein
MAHHTLKSGYAELTERLNRFPQGVTPSELLQKILSILFTERDAALVSLLPIKPFTAEKAAAIWKIPLTEARKTLDRLADKALLLDIEEEGGTKYVLPPPMAGFFEFSLMRLWDDINQKALSELFYEYMNVEDFIKSLFSDGETQLGASSSTSRHLPPRTPFRSSTTKGQARLSARHPTGGSVFVTAATKWRISAGPAARRWISA